MGAQGASGPQGRERRPVDRADRLDAFAVGHEAVAEDRQHRRGGDREQRRVADRAQAQVQPGDHVDQVEPTRAQPREDRQRDQTKQDDFIIPRDRLAEGDRLVFLDPICETAVPQ